MDNTHPRLDQGGMNPPEKAEELRELDKALRDALQSLPGDEREAIALCFFGGLTHEEASEAASIKLGTLKARVRRGLVRLQQRLHIRAESLEAYLASVAFVPPQGGMDKAVVRWHQRAMASDAILTMPGPNPAKWMTAATVAIIAGVFSWMMLTKVDATEDPPATSTGTTVASEHLKDTSAATVPPLVSPWPERPVFVQPAALPETTGAAAPSVPSSPGDPSEEIVPRGPNPVGSLQTRVLRYWPGGPVELRWIERVTTSGPVKEGTYEHLDKEGQILDFGEYTAGLKSGLWTKYHPNRKKASEGHFANDRFDGAWTMWHDSGNRQAEGNYVNGQRDGLWKFWGSAGQLYKAEQYVMGKLDGIVTRYDADGAKQSEQRWKNGKKDGPSTEFGAGGDPIPDEKKE